MYETGFLERIIQFYKAIWSNVWKKMVFSQVMPVFTGDAGKQLLKNICELKNNLLQRTFMVISDIDIRLI